MAKTHIRFDWAAKKMLRDKKNFDILEGFLSELLKEDIKIEGLLESEGNQEEEDDKFNRVDLYAENSKGEHIKKPSIQRTYPEYYLIQTTKFNNVINDTLDEWIYFFKNSEVLDGFHAKGMKEVRDKLSIMNLSEEERKRYDKFLENLHTEASITQTLTIEAEERVGKRKEVEVAIKCIKRGDSNEEIMEITDLTYEEIEELRKQLGEGNND
jgi:hypothetical protein